MSYIRSTSNPEGLYIFCTGKEVCICYHRRALGNNSTKDDALQFNVPTKVFHEVGRKWYNHEFEEDRDAVEFQGFRAELKWVDIGKVREHQVVLSYAGHEIYLWEVTWHYVVEAIMEELKMETIKPCNSDTRSHRHLAKSEIDGHYYYSEPDCGNCERFWQNHRLGIQ